MTSDDLDPQQVAANSAASALLVVAPPGCGKTELLARRAEVLISGLKPYQRILALTFTNRAKANLRARLLQTLGPTRLRRYVQVHNFHGHAAEILLAHGRTIGLSVSDLVMPNSKTLKRALEQFSSDPNANKASGDLLASIKRRPLSDEEVMAALDAAGDQLARRVEQERIKANQLHYEDLLRHAQRLLAIEQVANLCQQHYGATLVDEFQDLSLLQFAIALRSCTRSRTFAGDPLQGIYSWAGAAPRQVEQKLRELCGPPIQLTVSYRSSPAVLDMVNAVSFSMGAEPLRAASADSWVGGGVAAAVVEDTWASEAQMIASVSAKILAARPSASIGVITRSGWRRREIDAAFVARPELPCRRWDLAVDDPQILTLLLSSLASMPANVTFDEARERVVAKTDPADVETIELIEDAFAQLEEVATGSVRSSLSQFRPSREDEAIGPGVHLLNAHTGKGQQFDWVFVPGLEERHIPDRRNSQGQALEEEQRVLLVMVSRARHGLIVSRSESAEGRFGRYRTAQSRWWAALASAARALPTALQ